MNDERIKIFVTGGTFDKEYNELTGELYFRQTHVPEILQLGRAELQIDLSVLILIDSRNMVDEHRQMILSACERAEEKRIVITHGTDTMAQTARLLGERIREKTIVLTGATIPYKFGSSDGLFNLGSALAFAQALPDGVYIAMNGRYFPWDDVKKNYGTGKFEALRNQ
jgi:L-asparaginase